MSKINEFAKDIIISIFKLAFEYWYIIALVSLIIYILALFGKIKFLRKVFCTFKNLKVFKKIFVIIIIIIIIFIILNGGSYE